MNSHNYTGLIIDVGANAGDFSFEMAKRNIDILVLAIEPNPKLYEALETKINKEKIANIIPIKKAVGNKNESRIFNICNAGDSGVSSLLNFDKSHLEKNDYWKTRTDLSFSETTTVNVVRLDHILEKYAEELPIRFIKIDTQGFDLEVLDGMGATLNRVEMGCIEVFTTKNNSLYKNSTCDILTALKYLDEKNFKIQKIKPNDPANNEANVFFLKKEIDCKRHEIEIKIKNLLGYDDKDYWHSFSNKLHPELVVCGDKTLSTINNLETKVSELEKLIEQQEQEKQKKIGNWIRNKLKI